MSNSPLVSYTKISPNTWGKRTKAIDTITIHCVVGQCAIETLGQVFAPKARKASCNYGIGKDGRIGLILPEDMISQCSSNKANDSRAITIEVASDTTHPYAINDRAMNALIDLCADICKRNPGIPELRWKGNKSLVGKVAQQNMTVHRWFANKACPGDYIYNRLGDIAAKVNAKLKGTGGSKIQNESTSSTQGTPFKIRVNISNLNIRSGPGTEYGKFGNYVNPGVYTITKVEPGQGSKKGWGKLKSGVGWVSLDYVDIL